MDVSETLAQVQGWNKNCSKICETGSTRSFFVCVCTNCCQNEDEALWFSQSGRL